MPRCDDRGVDVTAVAATASPAVLCSPAHQFPTGVVLRPERRRSLLRWATESDALILEDDYDAEFRYDRRPVGALAGADRARVCYLGSCSKTLAPGLRLGWMVPPPQWRDVLVSTAAGAGAGPSALDQLTFADLLAGGGYDRHLRVARRAYRTRRDALVAAVHAHLPGIPLSGAAAGLHLVARLPDGIDDAALVTRLAEQHVLTAALSTYGIERPPAGLVLGYGRLAPGRADAAVAVIGRAIDESVGD